MNKHTVTLMPYPYQGDSATAIRIHTPLGQYVINASLTENGALVVFIDTDTEPTPDVLRVNVNDGPVFNYPDAVNWYGQDQGHPAPEGA